MKHFLMCSFLLASACSSPLAPAYVPPANPPHKLAQPVAECAIAVTVLGSSAKDGTLKVRNDDRCERRIGIAVYVIGSGGQTLFAHVAVMAAAGETVELKAALPSCARYQFDPYHTLEAVPADGNFGQGEHLFPAPYFGDTLALCPPPPPEPTVDPPTPTPTPTPRTLPPGPPVPSPPPTIPGVPPAPVPGLPPQPVPGLPPAPVPPAPVPPQPVCPTVTVDNWRAYVTATSVVAESDTSASASFTVTVANGCTVPLSVVSYRIRNCAEKFPQAFIAGSTPDGSPRLYGPGTYTQQMRVGKSLSQYQIDLRLDGFEPGHELTQFNEETYYERRTLDWLVDRVCLPDGM